jgi:hypothetical protein
MACGGLPAEVPEVIQTFGYGCASVPQRRTNYWVPGTHFNALT